MAINKIPKIKLSQSVIRRSCRVGKISFGIDFYGPLNWSVYLNHDIITFFGFGIERALTARVSPLNWASKHHTNIFWLCVGHVSVEVDLRLRQRRPRLSPKWKPLSESELRFLEDRRDEIWN